MELIGRPSKNHGYDLLEYLVGCGGTTDGEKTDIYHSSFDKMNNIREC